MDSLSFVYTGLLRNVKSLTYEIKDAGYRRGLLFQ